MRLTTAIIVSRFMAIISGLRILEQKNPFASKSFEVVKRILAESSQTQCSLIFIIDGSFSHSKDIVKNLSDQDLRKTNVYEVPRVLDDSNVTWSVMPELIALAREERRASWCTFVIAFSDNVRFLQLFAEQSLRGRLLRWVTKLLVVTNIEENLVQELMSQHWTFSMMNSMFFKYGNGVLSNTAGLYIHQPYTSEGPKVVKVTGWLQDKGFIHGLETGLFPEKYKNFHGCTINVTSKPFEPYWIEDEYKRGDGSKGIIYTGTDGNLFHVIANKLNFTFNVIPPITWRKGLELVAQRVFLMSPAYCNVLPNRLKLFEYSYEYEFAFLGFGMAKPSLIPQWQSLYYPLSEGVWLATIGCLVVVPPFFYLVTYSGHKQERRKLSYIKAAQNIVGTFLGQNFSGHLPTGGPSRTLIVAWLTFAFILGTAYKGNLTASLTSPKYSPRAENLEQLVEVADRATWGSYGIPYKVFFSQSTYEVFRKFADMLDFGPSVNEGLKQALENKRSATISGRRYMQRIIADRYTQPDGTPDIYIGKEAIMPGLSGWPIPHDAPYKANMDWCMMAVLEAGLYDQWSAEFIERTRLRSARRQREHLAKETTEGKEFQTQTRGSALTLDHLQGPLLLYAFGICFGVLSFLSEMSTRCLLRKSSLMPIFNK